MSGWSIFYNSNSKVIIIEYLIMSNLASETSTDNSTFFLKVL